MAFIVGAGDNAIIGKAGRASVLPVTNLKSTIIRLRT